MAQIFVQHHPKSNDLTGLDFLVEYDEATAAVSIQDTRGGSFQARQDAYRVTIMPSGLGHAGSGTIASRGSRSPSTVAESTIPTSLFGRPSPARRGFFYAGTTEVVGALLMQTSGYISPPA
jgi:hypothetical protein